jgi:hypothetical protein
LDKFAKIIKELAKTYKPTAKILQEVVKLFLNVKNRTGFGS